ncbi:hypothetical protein UFOVP753_57 [uncultured Caudovirales phage]|uniref:Uncharacterized protein n=1 Tax=uncultured Caudovirales phage TaxID=2100421 RepID=A0A6J7X6A0_9CAUD|nr:hypothetical protein UFOVP753_57 [uncultured Caudovirales phage]
MKKTIYKAIKDKQFNAIFYTKPKLKSWYLLTDNNGKTFTDLVSAIQYARTLNVSYLQLSTMSQALVHNAEWDNF